MFYLRISYGYPPPLISIPGQIQVMEYGPVAAKAAQEQIQKDKC